MMDMTKLEKLRPCGRLETYSTARHHLGFYKNVAIAATYTSSDESSIPLETKVFTALRRVITEHPNLSAIALNEDKSFPDVYFARLPEIDLRTCVEIHERKHPLAQDGKADEELDDLLAEQHARDFKEGLGSKPFWRLLVVKSSTEATVFTAAWIFHHTLADGASGFIFHETFLAGMNSPDPDTNAGPIVTSPIAALLPPLEDLHSMSISWPYFLQTILGAMLPSIFNRRPEKLWTGNAVPETIPSLPRPMCRTLVLSKETTTNLAKASRREKTSVTATLQCLIAVSLFANLPAAEYERITIDSPISMRPFLDVKERQMLVAIAQYDYLHTRRPLTPTDSGTKPEVLQHFSWDEARAVKATIVAEVAKKGRDNQIALLKYVSDIPKLLTEKLGKPRSPTVELSSLGVWQGKRDAGAGWAVGRMMFSQCPTVTGGAFAMNVITGGDGNAVISFSWREGAVEESMMRKVIEGVREGVEGLVGGDEG